MKTLSDIFKCWDSIPDLADDVGATHWAVTKWSQRQSIPVTSWPAVIKALKRKGKHVGASELLAMHVRSKGSPVSQPNNDGKAA